MGQRNRAVSIILSGTESDGTAGMLAIKAEGGVTFAQDSNSAKHYEMPRSSIAAGAVDIVLPPEEIARNLSCINGHPSPTLIEESDEIAPREVNVAIFQVLRLLNKSFGVDLSVYKSSVVQRRIHRRIAWLEKRPEELQAL